MVSRRAQSDPNFTHMTFSLWSVIVPSLLSKKRELDNLLVEAQDNRISSNKGVIYLQYDICHLPFILGYCWMEQGATSGYMQYGIELRD